MGCAPGGSRGCARPSGHILAQTSHPGVRPQGRGLPCHVGAWLNTTRSGVDPVPGPASQGARALPGAAEWRAPHRGPSGMPAPSSGLHTESRRRHPARTSVAAVPPNPIAACAPSSTPPSQPGPGSPPAPAPPSLEGTPTRPSSAAPCSGWRSRPAVPSCATRCRHARSRCTADSAPISAATPRATPSSPWAPSPRRAP